MSELLKCVLNENICNRDHYHKFYFEKKNLKAFNYVKKMVKERWGFYFFICGFYLLQQTFLWWRKFIGILRASCGSY